MSARKGVLVFWVLAVLAALVVLWLWCSRPRPDYARGARQNAQLRSIEAALGIFTRESGGLPPSDAVDEADQPYCGAMKLCEALMGQDLRGFDPNSRFRLDGCDGPGGTPLYTADTLNARKGPFLTEEIANAHKLVDIYGRGRTGPFPEHVLVLCDIYERPRETGIKAGMPVLYYRANTSLTAHDVNDPNNP
ncbi:MAG: hypothetical protein JSU70_23815 [Phycisphaerales bacterium]|nr:MAG: hypothetical protein JSU70_23815 [Phycisphaerales bacterium]